MEKLLRTFWVCMFFVCVNLTHVFAQQKTITGTVKDQKGLPLPGVSIQVKNVPTAGTQSNADGKFSVKVSSGDPVLIFSFIGFVTKEVSANSPVINMVMEEKTNSLSEVVVLAFGTQKRANVTGAVGTISGRDLVATPVSNIANALIGSTPGISGLQSSGEPGRNAASIYIRGVATYGNSSALVVIDGVEQASERSTDELNSMDANEIASVTILKDAASTAVYGIRGANGVIVVTTKRGRVGKPTISLSANFGSTKATNLQKGTTAYEWAVMRNEAVNTAVNAFGNAGYAGYILSPTDLWKLQNNRDFTPDEVAAYPGLTDAQRTQLNASPAVYYGSHDLYAEQFGNSGPQQQYNLSISGGTSKVKYFTSIGYFNQGTILNNTTYQGTNTGSNFNRYNFRSNFDIQATKNLVISVNIAGQFGTTVGPGANASPYSQGDRYKLIEQYIYDGNPINTQGILDGHLVNNINGQAGTFANPLGLKIINNTVVGSQNAVYNLISSGTGTLYNTLLDNKVSVTHTMDYLTKGLSVHATASYQDNYTKSVLEYPAFSAYTFQRDVVNPNKIDYFGGGYGATTFNPNPGYNYTWNKMYYDAGIDYARTFGPHAVSAVIVGKAQLYTLPGNSNTSSDGYNTPSGLEGLVARGTYNYKEKYLAEFDLGYNGTEQFEEHKRFGIFPAFSAGWVPTNESFLKDNKVITYLKVRGSYGIVGNDQITVNGQVRRYLYLPNTYNQNLNNSNNNQGYYLGNSTGGSQNAYYVGTSEGAIGNPDVTWEKAKKYDIGLDARFFTDRLALTADVFKEDRDNILTVLATIPATYGVASSSVPPVNVGKTTNKGFETSLGWTDRVKDFNYSVTGSVSYARNKIVYRAEAPNPYPWMNYTGLPIGQRLGLVTDGFYNTLAELANRPYNTYNTNQTTLGDIRYKDINGDGKIDNKDMVAIGFPNLPEYAYNLKINLSYKGFDINALFIGTANGSYYVNQTIAQPFNKSIGNAFQWQYDGRWTPQKAAAGTPVTYPRAVLSSYDAPGTANFSTVSDLWLVSNNFKRLKNLEVGYTFPASNYLKKASISSIRLYANGNNLITWDAPLQKMGIDPESTDGSSYVYPLTRVFTFGANIRF